MEGRGPAHGFGLIASAANATSGGRVFPLDRAAARFYAAFLSARGRAGRRTGLPDALVAATARAHGATLLATRNTKDFDGCGVALADPWDTP